MRHMVMVLTLAWVLVALAAKGDVSGPATTQRKPTTMARRDGIPRKVLIGTVISGYEIFSLPLERRFGKMDEMVEAVAAEAKSKYPGRGLDLVVLPEWTLGKPGNSMAERAVRLEAVRERIGACAQRHGCYLIAPLYLEEAEKPTRYSNAAVLVDRQGKVVGVYRKVHPVAAPGSEVLEDGTTPGREFPVFACDFGRVGIQICWDMSYGDGWEALARQGAEIVALPSASPQTRRPAMYALQHHYYVVSATPRDNASIFNPIGMIEGQITKGTALVQQIDLSYAILHWSGQLEEGRALSRKYGEKVGFHYYASEDTGIFWSNDPGMTIGQMMGSLNLTEMDAEVERTGRLQDKARGGPATMPERK